MLYYCWLWKYNRLKSFTNTAVSISNLRPQSVAKGWDLEYSLFVSNKKIWRVAHFLWHVFFHVILLKIRLKALSFQSYHLKNYLVCVCDRRVKYVIYVCSLLCQSQALRPTFLSSCGKYCKSRDTLMKAFRLIFQLFLVILYFTSAANQNKYEIWKLLLSVFMFWITLRS
jgi:hypothetical protein